MSSTIWTRCAGTSEIRPLALDPWRVVEAQHQIASRRLVDDDAEQEVLEEILERTKPPRPERTRLHYLLFTPFRYPPLRHGSRFGGRHERGIWYGAEERRTAFAEVAYHRLLFLEGSDADLGTLELDLTAFRAGIATGRGIDLTRSPFDRFRPALISKTSYRATQPLGAAMREAGVEAFRFESARDVERGANVAILAPGAFVSRRPHGLETWRCVATRELVEITKRDYFRRDRHHFPRADFLVRGMLPSPGV